ncbi:MAG: hypothetical protein ABIH90_02155 [Candidatus Aenigmatarchaeota archaeon]
MTKRKKKKENWVMRKPLRDIEFAVAARAILASMSTIGGWHVPMENAIAELRTQANDPFHAWIGELPEGDAWGLIDRARAHFNKLVRDYCVPRRTAPGSGRRLPVHDGLMGFQQPFLAIVGDRIPVVDSSVRMIVLKLLAHNLTIERAPAQAAVISAIHELGNHGRKHDGWVIDLGMILDRVNSARNKRQGGLTMPELRTRLEAIQANLQDMSWQSFLEVEDDAVHILSSSLREQCKAFLNTLIPVPDNVDPDHNSH